MKKILCLVAVLTILGYACTKEETIDNATTAAAFLKSREWKPTVIDRNPATSPAGKILYTPVAECEKDDRLKFSKDSLLVTKGAIICENAETGYQVTYSMDFNKRKITINGTEYMLGEVTDKQLKFFIRIPSQSGYDYQVYLYEHE
ncbi:hypothetical protein [uncultured Chitinophaga sp.]|uniref:hypothetical protein n=1 Tax=uncultured Chitinophaga sp. TaxID=339340 RepID=UPI0025CD18F5|nr:hypothetical protein [uncultured Chitinophaga sp.]